MGTALKEATPLAGYRLALSFQNGSTAVVNMARRVETLRFSRLARAQVFSTARAEGDRVVWTDAGTPFGVYCTELLDAMMMD